ncbi:MAG: hypothetical protein JWN02_1547 [Acidobacteria bacterium]|nr:hypothetical protein [Acidobacteriota bacterium]
MNTNENIQTQGVQAAAEAVPTLTVTHYQEVAANMTKVLEELRQTVIALQDPSQTARVRQTQSNVTEAFIVKTITMVEASPELLAVKKFDPAAAREVLQILEALGPVYDALRAVARDVKIAMDSRKAKIASGALQIYAIAKGVARDEVAPGLAVHVSDLKQRVKRGNGAKRKVKAKKSTASAPTTTTAAPSTAPGSTTQGTGSKQ